MRKRTSGSRRRGSADPEESARQDVDAIRATKGFPEGVAVSGHVDDVRTGRVRQVEPPGLVG